MVTHSGTPQGSDRNILASTREKNGLVEFTMLKVPKGICCRANTQLSEVKQDEIPLRIRSKVTFLGSWLGKGVLPTITTQGMDMLRLNNVW